MGLLGHTVVYCTVCSCRNRPNWLIKLQGLQGNESRHDGQEKINSFFVAAEANFGEKNVENSHRIIIPPKNPLGKAGLVEAEGIEPSSEKKLTKTATSLVAFKISSS